MESVIRGSAYAEEIAMKNEGNMLTSFLISTINPLHLARQHGKGAAKQCEELNEAHH